MHVQYVAQPADRPAVTLTVDTERTAGAASLPVLPPWTALDTHTCGGCPLRADPTATHCPAAADLVPIVDALRDLKSFERAEVTVTLPGKVVRRETDLQELVRSVVGLVLATSGCPVLRRMKPLAAFHQPFASFEETLFRAVSLHLVRAWFDRRDGKPADLDLADLRAHYEDVARVNQGLAKRIRSLGSGDAGVNGLIQLFSMSVCVSDELDGSLAGLRAWVHDDESGGPP